MKVRCKEACFFQNRHFEPNDLKYKGVYEITLGPKEKLHHCLEEIKAPEAPAKGKKKTEEVNALE